MPALPPTSPNTDDDLARLAAASMDPSDWRDLEYERLGYRPDLMADIAWRSRHDTPPPRPEIRPQPQLADLPQRLQVLALARSMEAAGMPIDLRPEFARQGLGGQR